MKRVLVAMSGGVDSSVAAAILKAEGYEVLGVTLTLWPEPEPGDGESQAVSSSGHNDAAAAADRLGLSHKIIDVSTEFSEIVLGRFVSDYLAGLTPNPCIECNRRIKFERLFSIAAEMDCELVATGHYARNVFQGGCWRLMRGVDSEKDQSYFLSMLAQEDLERLRFPLGCHDKEMTRRLAEELGLEIPVEAESMDICFLRGADYRSFLKSKLAGVAEPGPIVDTEGTVVGEHQGIFGFTVGQRRQLGIVAGEPRYVVRVIPESRTVVVGRRQDLAVGSMMVTETTTTGRAIPEDILVQYRGRGEAVAARFRQGQVEFADVQYAIAPGQTAAFYNGEEVLGSGVIAETSPTSSRIE